jgi:hypothetical protein
MYFDNCTRNAARRKRRYEATVKRNKRNRADRRKAEAAALARKKNEAPLLALPRAVPLPALQAPAIPLQSPVLPVLNLTPTAIAAIKEAAKESRNGVPA